MHSRTPRPWNYVFIHFVEEYCKYTFSDPQKSFDLAANQESGPKAADGIAKLKLTTVALRHAEIVSIMAMGSRWAFGKDRPMGLWAFARVWIRSQPQNIDLRLELDGAVHEDL